MSLGEMLREAKVCRIEIGGVGLLFIEDDTHTARLIFFKKSL